MDGYSDIYSAIWLVFLGICLAAVYAYFNKRFLGSLIRRLIAEKASSPSTAKSLSDLGYKAFSAFIMRKCLKPQSGLRKYVFTDSDEASTASQAGDGDLLFTQNKKDADRKYYLPYENYEIAEKRYEEKGTTLAAVLLTIAVFFIVAIISMALVPFFMDIGTPDAADSPQNGAVTDNAFDAPSSPEKVDSNDDGISILGPSENRQASDSETEN